MVVVVVSPVLFRGLDMVEETVEEVGMVDEMVEEVVKSGVLAFSVVQRRSSSTSDNSGYVWFMSETMLCQALGVDRRFLLLLLSLLL